MSADPAHRLIAAIVRSLTQPLAQQPALPALDPADLQTGLKEGSRAAFGHAEAIGEHRAIKASEAALADLKRNPRAGIFEWRRSQRSDWCLGSAALVTVPDFQDMGMRAFSCGHQHAEADRRLITPSPISQHDSLEVPQPQRLGLPALGLYPADGQKATLGKHMSPDGH